MYMFIVYFLFVYFNHLSPMGPINELQHCPYLTCGLKGSTYLSAVYVYEF